MDKINVFISYSRKNHSDLEWLRAFLQSEDFNVVVDQQDILPGEKWKDRLKGLIRNADVVLFLMSNASLNSEICDWEVDLSSKYGKRIIPVVIEETITITIPEKLQELHFVFMRSGRERGENLKRLSDSLRINHTWVRFQTMLFDRATAWQERGCAEDELLAGAALEEASDHILDPPFDAPRPPEVIMRFVKQSGAVETRQREEAVRFAEERAEKERALRFEAESRELAAEARLLATTRPDLAALLAIHAWKIDENPTTKASLMAMALKWPRALTFVVASEEAAPAGFIDWHPNRISFSSSGALCLIASGPSSKSITLIHAGRVPKVVTKFRHDFSVVATAIDEALGLMLLLGKQGQLTILPLKQERGTVPTVKQVADELLDVSAMVRCESSTLMIANESSIFQFDYVTNHKTTQTEVKGIRHIQRLRYIGGGRTLVTGFSRLTEPRNGKASVVVSDQSHSTQQLFSGAAVPISGDNTLLCVGEDGSLERIDLGDGRKTSISEAPKIQSDWCLSARGTQIAYAEKKTVDFGLLTIKGGFAKPHVLRPYTPEPIHNGYTISVEALPSGFGAGFISVGKEGSTVLWSENCGSVLFRGLDGGSIGAGGNIGFSDDGNWIIEYGNRGYTLWECVSGQVLRKGEEKLAACGLFSNEAIGILTSGAIVSLSSGDQIAKLPPIAFARAEGSLAVAALENGLIVKLDLSTLQYLACGRFQRSEGFRHRIEIDGATRRFGYNSGNNCITIRKFDDDVEFEIKAETHLNSDKIVDVISSFHFLQGSDEIALCSTERSRIVSVDGQVQRFEYGTGSGIGSPVLATSLPNKEFVIFLEGYGSMLSIVDGQYRSVQADLQHPTDASIYEIRASPTKPMLAVSGERGIQILDLTPDVLLRRLESFSGRILSGPEKERYKIDEVRI